MFVRNNMVLCLIFALFVSACSSNDDDNDSGDSAIAGPIEEGASLTLRNTLEEGGPEGSFPGLFGLEDNAFDEFSTLSFSDVEFPTALAQPATPVGDISGLYSIDLTSSAINFNALPTAADPFWSGVFGVFPAGKFDRYYFTFSEPHNVAAGTSNNDSVILRVDSDFVLVVEISEGYDLSPGISFSISLE